MLESGTGMYFVSWVSCDPRDPDTAAVAITGQFDTDREGQVLLMPVDEVDALMMALQEAVDRIQDGCPSGSLVAVPHPGADDAPAPLPFYPASLTA